VAEVVPALASFVLAEGEWLLQVPDDRSLSAAVRPCLALMDT